MEQSGFIVCVDFGTSKIVGVLGRKNEQGVISILASESLPSDSCVRYGVIYSIEEAAGKIKKLIHLLENKSGRKIGKIYVSIAGKSLRAIEHAEIKHLDGQTPLSFSDLDRMEQQAKLNKPELFTNYGVLSPEYFLDTAKVEDPINKVGTSIEVRYRLLVGRPNIKNNLQKSIVEKLKLGVAGYVVGPVATGVLVLEESDRENGCALVDFGAGTTTLSIYKDGLLRYMSVIPFGGRTITKDIQALGFAFDAAEAYKIKYGRVGKKVKIDRANTSDVDLKELNKVIQLRQDEIIMNLVEQIKLSGSGDNLEAGIIMVGGASRMEGLEEYLAEKSEMSVKGGAPKRVYINNAADLLLNPIYTQVLGMMIFAHDNCEQKEVPKVEPVYEAPKTQPEIKTKEQIREKKKSGFGFGSLFGKLQDLGGAIFTEEEDEDEE